MTDNISNEGTKKNCEDNWMFIIIFKYLQLLVFKTDIHKIWIFYLIFYWISWWDTDPRRNSRKSPFYSDNPCKRKKKVQISEVQFLLKYICALFFPFIKFLVLFSIWVNKTVGFVSLFNSNFQIRRFCVKERLSRRQRFIW